MLPFTKRHPNQQPPGGMKALSSHSGGGRPARDPRARQLAYQMRPDPRPDLGKRELYAPEQDLRVDVRGVTFDDRGARLRLKLFSDGFLSCPKHLLVVRSSGGQVLGYRYVQTEGYSVLGLKSGLVPCTAEVSLRIQPASRQTGIRFEVYPGDVAEEVATGNASGADGARSQTYFLDDLANVARRNREEAEEAGPVESAVSAAVSPVLKWGTGLVGLYLVLDNRELISDLARDLFTTEQTDQSR